MASRRPRKRTCRSRSGKVFQTTAYRCPKGYRSKRRPTPKPRKGAVGWRYKNGRWQAVKR